MTAWEHHFGVMVVSSRWPVAVCILLLLVLVQDRSPHCCRGLPSGTMRAIILLIFMTACVFRGVAYKITRQPCSAGH